MNFYRALKKQIRKGNLCVSRKTWKDGETLYFQYRGPLAIADTKTPPPFKRRDLTVDDLIATDWE